MNKYISFQTKVLIPVIGLLIVLFSITIFLVNRRLSTQVEQNARQTLSTAEGVFRNSLEIRTRNLQLRYQNVANEPRLKAVAQLGEPKTMTVQLNELLEELGAQVIFYTAENGQTIAGAAPDNVEELQSITASVIHQAMTGRAAATTVAVKNRIYDFISVPVKVGDSIVGVLTIGVQIDETAANEIKSLTHAEIAFLSGNDVIVSTLPGAELYPRLSALFQQLNSAQSENSAREMRELTSLQGEHFLCMSGLLAGKPRARLEYLLLSSYQQALNEMQSTRRTLWALSIAGILFSLLFVGALIGKIIEPLHQLRESAEAVGRGDFSRSVEVQTHDEFGQLALAFNQMTDNLTTSRAQVESAVKSLQETQAQLIQTEKLSAIGEFVAGVAHELNNPLTAVIGFSEMLQDSGIDKRQQIFANRVIEGAERCHRIVQNLLGFARQHQPERKSTSINKLMEHLIEILNYEFRTGNIEVELKLSPEIPELLIDPHQMQQVFLNIVNNARQAIEEHQASGKITITTLLVDGKCRILIEDNGPGIPSANLRRIFDPFFTTKPIGVGTGLGLSLSYGIVHEHGGTINVRSEPGEGACFTIELPAYGSGTETKIEKRISEAAPTDPNEGKGKKILVIDDEEVILDLFREALGRKGYFVETAREGNVAIRHFQENKYDLIVCDWKIPGLGGQQIFERLCALDPAVANRFIFMTGDSLSSKAQTFLSGEERSCLFKPFSVEELHSTIRKLIFS